MLLHQKSKQINCSVENFFRKYNEKNGRKMASSGKILNLNLSPQMKGLVLQFLPSDHSNCKRRLGQLCF
jgi:hypothetical protein